MSLKGDLVKIKQIFSYVKEEKISVEEMGVNKNQVNLGKKLTLVDTNSGHLGSTPLMEAARFGHHEVCEYLITQENANLEAIDNDQRTALIIASSRNKTEVIKVLLQHKANVMARTKNGSHAAYLAALIGYPDTLKMLIEEDGAVINLKGLNGETPLIVASRRKRVDLCKYLVENENANVDLKDNNGKTAIQYAKTRYIIEILENYGAKSLKKRKPSSDDAKRINKESQNKVEKLNAKVVTLNL